MGEAAIPCRFKEATSVFTLSVIRYNSWRSFSLRILAAGAGRVEAPRDELSR
jgi:hypothetical protein